IMILKLLPSMGKDLHDPRLNGSGCTLGSQGGKECQQQDKRQKAVKAYIARPNNKNGYGGKLPFYKKCKLHHTGPCTDECNNYERIDHMTRDLKTPVSITT
ncbi:hypothetical protein Tco_0301568, partial [Tanacetum coccineum]